MRRWTISKIIVVKKELRGSVGVRFYYKSRKGKKKEKEKFSTTIADV